jgi:predicted house-cleaning noncanonical NTP pyrophosphatase (MazG superfamily)
MEKLVRDKIIQKILDNGENPQYRIATQQEKVSFLFQKLLEESQELIQDKNQEEMADVLEVLYALMEQF